MDFSVAITTYNRPAYLDKLIRQLLCCSLLPTDILVVDSSEVVNDEIRKIDRVEYIRSSHKNQPYQRYLAYLCCKTEVIIFLDDDLEIIDFSVFEVMLNRLSQPGIKGVSVGFKHHQVISDLLDAKIDDKSIAFRLINFLSGVPVLRPGKIYLAGLAGPRPDKEAAVDYFNGAIMGFYKRELQTLFNPVLFSLFERKLGMGEDKVISMEVGIGSAIWFVPQHFFIHPPVTSNYFQDIQSFQRKVIYSRLYISLQYGRLKGYSRAVVYLHYYYYAAWRLLISGVRALVIRGKQGKLATKGIFEGILLTFTLPFNEKKITPKIDWKQDVTNDLNRFSSNK